MLYGVVAEQILLVARSSAKNVRSGECFLKIEDDDEDDAVKYCGSLIDVIKVSVTMTQRH